MRVHGRRGRLYVALSTTTAEPVAYANKWGLEVTAERVDVTVNGDPNRVYASKRPEHSGSFTGWYDQASADTYTAATDGLTRRFYLYPTAQPRPYFFGTGVFGFAAESSVDDAVKVSGDWAGDDVLWFVGVSGEFSNAFSVDFDGG